MRELHKYYCCYNLFVLFLLYINVIYLSIAIKFKVNFLFIILLYVYGFVNVLFEFNE